MAQRFLIIDTSDQIAGRKKIIYDKFHELLKRARGKRTFKDYAKELGVKEYILYYHEKYINSHSPSMDVLEKIVHHSADKTIRMSDFTNFAK